MLTRLFGVILGLWTIDSMPERLDVDDALLAEDDAHLGSSPVGRLTGPT